MIYSVILNVVLIGGYLFFSYRKRNAQIKKKISKEEKKREQISENLNYFIKEAKCAKTLSDLYITHIKMWANGIRNNSFGPNEMFKTKNILKMTPEEVHLGNVWGLPIKPLTYWETSDDKKLVLEQYRSVLVTNMESMLANL